MTEALHRLSDCMVSVIGPMPWKVLLTRGPEYPMKART
jgi:hypothetical protein